MLYQIYLKEIWRFRYFISSTISAENKNRFARSKLGGLWLLLHPLAQAVILAVVLSQIMRAKFEGIDSTYGYAVYLLSGTVGWTFFNEVLTRCVSVFRDNANSIKKIAFPKICLPVIVTGSSLINYLLLLVCVLVIFLFLGQGLGAQLLWLPLVSLVTLIFAMSVGLILGILNVFIRDVGQVVPIALQLLYWATPVVYKIDFLPERFRPILEWNPLYYLIGSYQNILAYKTAPLMTGLLVIGAFGIVFMAIALFLFRKASSDLVDQL